MSKKKFEDDGRVIADMSSTVKTPWYLSFTALSKKKNKTRESLELPEIEMTKKEQRQFTISAILASLVVALIFIGALFLFILFCVYIWFK